MLENLARRAGLELFPTGEQRKPALLGEKAELGGKVRILRIATTTFGEVSSLSGGQGCFKFLTCVANLRSEVVRSP